MLKKLAKLSTSLVFVVLSVLDAAGQIQAISGTLVVAVPVKEGLVACSDKRAYNNHTGAFTDDLIKIRKVNNNALFVATNTVGFLDSRTGKMAFDAFEITSRYAARHNFTANQQFWDGLKIEIRKHLLEYLAKRKFADQPETDRENNNLLFNLIFYSISKESVRSHSLRVFYEKAATPIVYIPDVTTEEVKTPKLSGKGRDVMDYLSKDPTLSRDPSILQFDQANFDIQTITTTDAVSFAKKLFTLANTAVPQARVSATYDCALLSYENGFQWIKDSGLPRAK